MTTGKGRAKRLRSFGGNLGQARWNAGGRECDGREIQEGLWISPVSGL